MNNVHMFIEVFVWVWVFFFKWIPWNKLTKLYGKWMFTAKLKKKKQNNSQISPKCLYHFTFSPVMFEGAKRQVLYVFHISANSPAELTALFFQTIF